jgi:CRP-like cAMP-binding protein
MNPTRTTREACEFILNRYQAFAPLNAEEAALFRTLDAPIETVPRGRDLHLEGRPVQPRFLLSGWACRFRILGDGRRMIMGFILPGDGIGVCKRHHPLALASVVALTDCRTLAATPSFSHGADLSAHANLRHALSVAHSLDEAWLLDQVMRLGRQTAFERMAHLLLELHWRLSQVKLADEGRFQMPLTQEVLADATGLSVVHVNRTIQQLRRERLIEWRNHTITILEPALLTEMAEFKPPRPSDWV